MMTRSDVCTGCQPRLSISEQTTPEQLLSSAQAPAHMRVVWLALQLPHLAQQELQWHRRVGAWGRAWRLANKTLPRV